MIKIIKDIPQKREEIFSVTMKTPDVSEIVKGIIDKVKTENIPAVFFNINDFAILLISPK